MGLGIGEEEWGKVPRLRGGRVGETSA